MERYRSGHNGAVLKTVRVQAHVGSNPTLSAIHITICRSFACEAAVFIGLAGFQIMLTVMRIQFKLRSHFISKKGQKLTMCNDDFTYFTLLYKVFFYAASLCNGPYVTERMQVMIRVRAIYGPVLVSS